MLPELEHPSEAEYLEIVAEKTDKLRDLLYGTWPMNLEEVKERYAEIADTAEEAFNAADDLMFWYGNDPEED